MYIDVFVFELKTYIILQGNLIVENEKKVGNKTTSRVNFLSTYTSYDQGPDNTVFKQHICIKTCDTFSWFGTLPK